jgi:hypothetical protein
LATGEWLGAWALTEPNTGSDAMRMKCTAKKEGKEWVLNGTKCWITHGKSSDVVVAIVRTGDLLDSKGMTTFVIERGTPGMKAGKKENKLGMRASETAEVIFEDCRVSRGEYPWQRRGRLPAGDEDPGWGPHQHRCLELGYCQRGLRCQREICQGAPAVRPAHRQLPGHQPSNWPIWPHGSKPRNCSSNKPASKRTTVEK